MSLPNTDQLFREKREDSTFQAEITRQLVLLHAASRNISSTLESQQVYELVTQEYSNLLSASACFLGLLRNDLSQFEIVAKNTPNGTKKRRKKIKSILSLHPSLISNVASRRNILHISKDIPGTDKKVLKVLEKSDISSMLLLPLLVNNKIIGIIEILREEIKLFETYEIVIARLLANQAAISIENAWLYQNAQQEILARKETEEKLKFNALHDVLTNLPNRVLFLDRLEQAIFRYKRNERLEYAVFFVDLDRFKRINDTFGHLEGDQALREIANRLSNSIREGDTLCRFGGDEFLVLLEGEINSITVNEIAKRVQKDLASPIYINGNEFHLTASIGIAFSTSSNSSDAYEFVRNANFAMYQAKAKGGGRTEIFSPTQGLMIQNNVILESAIREAVRLRSFTFNYQPIYNLDTLSIAGFEVLLRWEKDGEQLQPAKFIPMLERFGLMPELGLWILDQSFQKYQEWVKTNFRISKISMSINISNVQLAQEDFVLKLVELLEKTQIDPNIVILEITEHVLIEDIKLAESRIRSLNELGLKVHLDDFGTGYSSLSHLNDLPVQALKIDRKFVQQINPAEMDRGLVTSILGMARKFNVDVVGEGIETESQLRGLRFADCKYGQGNFLSPPVNEDRFLNLIRKSPFLI